MDFASLGLSENIVKAVNEAGYTEATDVQAAAIPAALLGKDLIVWLLLALGGALFAGNVMALVRPPQQLKEGDLLILRGTPDRFAEKLVTACVRPATTRQTLLDPAAQLPLERLPPLQIVLHGQGHGFVQLHIR